MEKSTGWGQSIFAPTSPLGSLYNRFEDWRISLGLPNPGTMENVGREVKLAHLSNYIFDGGRADLSKSISLNPAFQVSHSFSLGSMGNLLEAGAGGGGSGGGMYNFTGVFATNKVFMQGMLDQTGSLSGRFNYGWSPSDITKIQTQVSPSPMNPSVIQVEHDRHGLDYVLSLKAYNPSPADYTGIYGASYLQSVTPNLALGLECVLQRPVPMVEEAALSYALKYTGTNKDWIATCQLQAQGMIQSTYWQKISERVEAAAELKLTPSLIPTERKAVATVGAKYDFKTATFRSQIDSKGKISALLEQRFTPLFAFLVAGTIDHWNNNSKFGVGIQLESYPPIDEEQARQSGIEPVVPPM